MKKLGSKKVLVFARNLTAQKKQSQDSNWDLSDSTLYLASETKPMETEMTPAVLVPGPTQLKGLVPTMQLFPMILSHLPRQITASLWAGSGLLPATTTTQCLHIIRNW